MQSVDKALLVLLCLSAGAMGTPAVALGSAIEADVAPPPVRDERSPPPREGYIWAPGYWEWGGHTYSWIPGHFIFERRGAHWVADRWDQVGSHWQHVTGHWEH